MSGECVTNLLPDEPTTRDVFGSHERVASAIAQLISSETVGRTVAITGPWGSGKSSVLRMVRERLNQTSDVFIFDAWAHEGDPLRRTFLQRLIDFLVQDRPDQELAALSRDLVLRKKSLEVTTTPVLTWEAKLVALALILTPVGLAIFSAALGKPSAWWGWAVLGLALPLLPTAVLVVFFLAGVVRAATSAIVQRLRDRRFARSMVGALVVFAVVGALERHRLASVFRAVS